MKTCLRLLIPFLLVTIVSTASIFDQTSKGKCQPISIPMCQNSPYNYTYFPNSIVPYDLQSLQSQAEHFNPLVKTKCHPNLLFFICSVFAPMCPLEVPQLVTSCRSVCQEVKKDCLKILDEFDLAWPDVLNCSRFPEEPALCMKPTASYGSSDRSSAVQRRPFQPSSCPVDLLDLDRNDPNGVCAFKCGADVMFSSQDKAAARSWMLLWGTIDLAVSLFTFLTFLIDRRRFRYPQRCIGYLSLCYLMYSLPHLFPFILPYSAMACEKLNEDELYLIASGYGNTNCLMSFVVTFYFGTASTFWWLMFAFTWYLSAGRKWVPEGIDACSSYLHFFSWGISALLTIAVLVMHKVDASELTGLCGVGNSHPQSLLYFSLIPRTVLVLAGCAFMLAGFASMCRERDSFRRRGTDTSKLEKFLIKMAMFCLLFVVPAVIVLVCDSYHLLIMNNWYPQTIACKQSAAEFGTVGMRNRCNNRPAMPQAQIHLLGLMMSLAGGISCAMWIFTPKSFLSWQQFICCGLCGSAPHKNSQPVSRPLLEPPTAPPPQPPSGHYLPMSTHSQSVWRPSKVL